MRPEPDRATPPRISVRGLVKQFEIKGARVNAIDGINFEVADGEFVCLVGPSGCGKTTALRIIAGLETLTAGDVEVRYQFPKQPTNAMVFQDHSIFPWMTVEKNVEFGLLQSDLSSAKRRERIDRYVETVGLSRFRNAYPHQLSGGMKQRVSIARAFAADPEVLLMDEPFGALDEQTRLVLQEELLRIWSGTRKTVVFITHSIEEAVALADRVIVLSAHPGRVKATVPIEIARPRRVVELRRNPAFGEYVYGIWQNLQDAGAHG
jgi:NitT/TauT family transport system ATP-binding protein